MFLAWFRVSGAGATRQLALPARSRSHGSTEKLQDVSTVPKSPGTSYVNFAVNVCLPAEERASGTRHEYPQVPPHPNGIAPDATTAPAASVIVTVGLSDG